MEAFVTQQTAGSKDNSTSSSSSRHKSDNTSAQDEAVSNHVKNEFELRYRYLKRVPGGYSAYKGSQRSSKDDSNCWDAGTA